MSYVYKPRSILINRITNGGKSKNLDPGYITYSIGAALLLMFQLGVFNARYSIVCPSLTLYPRVLTKLAACSFLPDC
jgi:hypothetical protein